MASAICERCSASLDADQIEPACERCGLDGCCADCMSDHVCRVIPKIKRGRKPKDPEARQLARLALIRQRALVISLRATPPKGRTP